MNGIFSQWNAIRLPIKQRFQSQWCSCNPDYFRYYQVIKNGSSVHDLQGLASFASMVLTVVVTETLVNFRTILSARLDRRNTLCSLRRVNTMVKRNPLSKVLNFRCSIWFDIQTTVTSLKGMLYAYFMKKIRSKGEINVTPGRTLRWKELVTLTLWKIVLWGCSILYNLSWVEGVILKLPPDELILNRLMFIKCAWQTILMFVVNNACHSL